MTKRFCKKANFFINTKRLPKKQKRFFRTEETALLLFGSRYSTDDYSLSDSSLRK